VSLSLRLRIALISATAVAIAIAIAAIVTYNAAKSELIAEVDASLYERVEQVEEADNIFEVAAALIPFDETRQRGPFERGSRGFDAIYWRFFFDDGVVISLFDDLPLEEEEQQVVAGETLSVVRTVAGSDHNLRVLTSQISVGTVQVGRSLAEVDSSLAGLASVLRLAAIVGVLLAGGVGYLVSRGAARPIGALAEAAEHVAATQELAAQIDVDRNDEVGRLARSFNAMLAALESSRQQQSRLVHDAGHELRTPLTAIRTNVELLGRMDNIPSEEREQMLTDIDNEIQELSGLVAELVDLAAEPPTGEVVVGEVELGDLVEGVVEKYRRRTGRVIEASTDDSVVIGSGPLLERALGNLLDNAAKWSPDDAPIAVSVVAGRVSVADQGPGIDADDRPHVFDRFYRATKDRSTPGSGLGLSIVAKVAEDLGGSVFVADSDTGAVVGFEIPLAEEPEATSDGEEVDPG
jgi:two-component system sensor histidine kinase MprB